MQISIEIDQLNLIWFDSIQELALHISFPLAQQHFDWEPQFQISSENKTKNNGIKFLSYEQEDNEYNEFRSNTNNISMNLVESTIIKKKNCKYNGKFMF